MKESSYTTYDAILRNLGKTKESWLQLLKHNDIRKIWMHKLDFLIQSKADLREWNTYWSGNVDTIIDEICDYRQHKMQLIQANLSFKEFEAMYVANKQNALEILFVEAIPDWMVVKLEAAGVTYQGAYEARILGEVDHAWNVINIQQTG